MYFVWIFFVHAAICRYVLSIIMVCLSYAQFILRARPIIDEIIKLNIHFALVLHVCGERLYTSPIRRV